MVLGAWIGVRVSRSRGLEVHLLFYPVPTARRTRLTGIDSKESRSCKPPATSCMCTDDAVCRCGQKLSDWYQKYIRAMHYHYQ